MWLDSRLDQRRLDQPVEVRGDDDFVVAIRDQQGDGKVCPGRHTLMPRARSSSVGSKYGSRRALRSLVPWPDHRAALSSPRPFHACACTTRSGCRRRRPLPRKQRGDTGLRPPPTPSAPAPLEIRPIPKAGRRSLRPDRQRERDDLIHSLNSSPWKLASTEERDRPRWAASGQNIGAPSSARQTSTAASGPKMSCRSPPNVMAFNRERVPFAAPCERLPIAPGHRSASTFRHHSGVTLRDLIERQGRDREGA